MRDLHGRSRLSSFGAATTDPVSPAGACDFHVVAGSGAVQVSIEGQPWQDLAVAAGGGALIVSATVAALAAVNVTGVASGSPAWVRSLLAQWSLEDVAPSAVDNIKVAQAADGVRFWVRGTLGHPNWATQASWDIDTATGNDENPGTAALPLASFDELRRRLSGQVVPQVTQVNLHGGPYGDLVCDWQTATPPSALVAVAMIFVGDITATGTEVLTGVTAHNNASGTRAFGEVAFGVDVSAHVNELMTMVDGAAINATAFHLEATGGGPTGAVTGPFLDAGNNETFPGIGDTVQFATLTQVNTIHVEAACVTAWNGVHVTQGACFRQGADNSGSVGRNRWDGDIYAFGASPNQGSSAGDQGASLGAQFGGDLFTGRLIADRGGLCLLQSCRFNGSDGGVFCKSGGQVGISLTLAMAGANGATDPVLESQGLIRVAGGGAFAFTTYGAASDCIRVYDNGRITCPANVWGQSITAGAGLAIDARAGSIFTYTAANKPDFLPRDAYQVGGTAKTAATLPYPEPTNYAAIVADA